MPFTAHFTPLDFAVVLFYFALVLTLGLRHLRRKEAQRAESFLIAGRRLTLPFFVATLVSSTYGGILGVGEFSYTNGLATWIAMGGFFYVFAFIYALAIAGKVHALGTANAHFTVSDRLRDRYGNGVARLAAVFIFMMVSPAPYLVIVATLVSILFGVSFELALMVAAALSVAYIFSGGLESVVWVEALQFVVMYVGFGIIIPFAVMTYGGLGYLRSALPEAHLQPLGTLSVQYLLVWGMIALWIFIDPNFFQRCLAAKSDRTARNGILISIGFWILFDFFTCTAGLYARAALPNIAPITSYPALAEAVLPSFWKGLFYAGMLSSAMSATSGLTFLSAMTVGRDFIQQRRGSPDDALDTGDASEASDRGDAAGSLVKLKGYVQIGLGVTLATSLAVAYLVPSVVTLWYSLGSISIPALLLPVLTTFTDRVRVHRRWIAASIVLTAIVSITSLVAGQTHLVGGEPQYPLGIEPMHAGFLVSISLLCAAWFFYPPHPASPHTSLPAHSTHNPDQR